MTFELGHVRSAPGVLDESGDESPYEGGRELVPDRVEEVTGHLDEVPETGLALGVGEVANLIRGHRNVSPETLAAGLLKKIRRRIENEEN